MSEWENNFNWSINWNIRAVIMKVINLFKHPTSFWLCNLICYHSSFFHHHTVLYFIRRTNQSTRISKKDNRNEKQLIHIVMKVDGWIWSTSRVEHREFECVFSVFSVLHPIPLATFTWIICKLKRFKVKLIISSGLNKKRKSSPILFVGVVSSVLSKYCN